MITANVLRAIAASWLRYEKQCPLVTFERGLEHNSNPDVLAIDDKRFMIEIEIKISMSDFRHDATKSKWFTREKYSHLKPRLFYYLVTPDIQEKVLAELKPGHGLLSIKNHLNPHTGLPEISCIKKPTADKSALRVSAYNCMRLIKQQSGTICGLANFEAQTIYSMVAQSVTYTLPSGDR